MEKAPKEKAQNKRGRFAGATRAANAQEDNKEPRQRLRAIAGANSSVDAKAR